MAIDLNKPYPYKVEIKVHVLNTKEVERAHPPCYEIDLSEHLSSLEVIEGVVGVDGNHLQLYFDPNGSNASQKILYVECAPHSIECEYRHGPLNRRYRVELLNTGRSGVWLRFTQKKMELAA